MGDDPVDVSLFGYLRGGDYKKGKGLYLSGLGYINYEDVKVASDPCPPFLLTQKDKKNIIGDDKEETKAENKNGKTKTKKPKKKVTLKDREKIIFAP